MKRVLQKFRKSRHDNSDDQRYYRLNNDSLLTGSIASQKFNSNPQKLSQLQNQLQLIPKQKKADESFLKKIYFTPQSKFIICVSIIKMFLIYVYFVQIPITIAFEHHRQQKQNEKIFQLINFPSIAFFIITIFIRLKTAFYKEGVLISQQRAILKNYFIFHFIFDFLSITSVIVYEISQIIRQHNQPIAYRFIVILFFLKVPELFQIQKSIINAFDLNRRIKALIKLFLLLAKIFMVCNITACGFFYLSDSLCPLLKQTGEVVCFDCCWVNQLIILNQPIKESVWNMQYSFSLYWASTTMISIGYGDITPLNHEEVKYTIAVQFIACFVFAFSINAIWGIIQEMKVKKMTIHARMNVINVYMRDKNVSESLKSRVNAYLSHFYHTKNLRSKDLENQIIQQLTPSLRKQLYYESFGFIFSQHSFFKNFSDQFLGQASESIKQIGYFQEQLLFQPNEQGVNLPVFYLKKGSLQNYVQLGPNSSNYVVLSKIKKQMIIGLPEFVKQINYKSSMMATKYSLLYSLSFEDWKSYIQEYDEDYEIYHFIKHSALYELDLGKLKVRCSFCGSKNHQAQQCLSHQFLQEKKEIISKYMRKSPRSYYERSTLKAKIQMTSLSQMRSSRRIVEEFSRVSMRQSQSPTKLGLKRLNSAKVSFHNNPQHNERMSKVFEKKKLMDSLWSEDSQNIEQIAGQMFSMQKVQNYEKYFPNFNANSDRNREKRKIALNNLFNE